MIRCSLLFASVLGLAMIAPASAQGAAPTAQARGAGASDEAATTGARAETTADVVPGTGDAVVDRLLVDINDYAARHREAFIDELVRYFDAPRPLVTDLLVERRWAAGDVYYACALARVAGRPCRALLDAWAGDSTQGWAPIAARMGVAKDSAQARRLRDGIGESYVRWARPLPPDAAP